MLQVPIEKIERKGERSFSEEELVRCTSYLLKLKKNGKKYSAEDIDAFMIPKRRGSIKKARGKGKENALSVCALVCF